MEGPPKLRTYRFILDAPLMIDVFTGTYRDSDGMPELTAGRLEPGAYTFWIGPNPFEGTKLEKSGAPLPPWAWMLDREGRGCAYYYLLQHGRQIRTEDVDQTAPTVNTMKHRRALVERTRAVEDDD